MKKNHIIIIGLVVLALAFAVVVVLYKNQITPIKIWPKPAVAEYKNLTYTIESQDIALVNGYSEIPAATGSVSKITTQYFGNEAFGDINNDNTADVAFLLTQQTGGSGTFYYLVVAFKTATGYQPGPTKFLGDRIAPQPTQINLGTIIVNYADRKPNDPMSTEPSVAVSRYFTFANGQLLESPAKAVFGENITLVPNKKIMLSDGLTITLEQLYDSRCKPNIVCIWAGEITAQFSLSGGVIGLTPKEVILGTTRIKSATLSGYTIILQSATPTLATFMVTLVSK